MTQWAVIHMGDDGIGGVSGPYDSQEEAIEAVLTDGGVLDYAYLDQETHPDRLDPDNLPEGWELDAPDAMGEWMLSTDIWNWQVRQMT